MSAMEMPGSQWPLSAIVWLACFTALGGCGKEAQRGEREPTSVLTQTVAISSWSPTASLTGEIRARVQNDLSFRFAGRIASRNVDVGDHVEAGQVLAVLETDQQQADIDVAKAGVDSAEAGLKQATANFQRQAELFRKGYTTQSKNDDARQTMIAAQSSLDSAKSTFATAQNELDNATLRTDAPGIITARSAEVGQIVEAAQAIFTIANDGDRDAVFEVYEALLARRPANDTIELALVSNPAIKASGKVREVAPAVDPATGTVRVKTTIADAPQGMGLGAAVIGFGQFQPRNVIALPWTAFFTDYGRPAVWVVDEQTHVVSLRQVSVDSYSDAQILLGNGLKTGETVVTAGTQLLQPGQVVRPVQQPAPSPGVAP